MKLSSPKFKVKRGVTHAGLFVALLGYLVIATAYYSVARVIGFSGPWSSLIYTAAQLTGFLILLYIVRLEGEGFDSLWFGKGGLRELAVATVFLLAAFIAWWLLDILGALLGIPAYRWWERWATRSAVDLVPMLIFGLAAAFFEETAYRGYAITRLYTLTDNLALSAAISILFFTLLHLYFGPRVMLCILGWGTIDTILFLYRQSTKTTFYYHATNNFLVYFLFPLLGMLR